MEHLCHQRFGMIGCLCIFGKKRSTFEKSLYIYASGLFDTAVILSQYHDRGLSAEFT